MTQPPLTPEQIEAIAQELREALLNFAVAQVSEFSCSEAESQAIYAESDQLIAKVDALVAAARPKTCETCRWLSQRQMPLTSSAPYCDHPGAPIDDYGFKLTDQTTFGCTLWTPRED